MNAAAFSEWFEPLSIPSRIAALALIYSNLTLGARQMFVPDWTAGKKQRERAMEILHGLNEIHHTLSNLLLDYTVDEHNARPVEVFGQTLAEMEKRYRLENFLVTAIEFAQTPRLSRP
jgi:hypothetical protein